MLTRIISALVGMPLILFFLIKGNHYLTFFTFALAGISLFEFYRAMKTKGYKTNDIMGYFYLVYFFFLIVIKANTNIMGFIITISIISLFLFEIISNKRNFIDIIITIFAILYIPFLLSHIVYIDSLENSKILVWIPFLTAWYTDTFAYFVGVNFGRVKLCPKVSPKKSVEGAIGGLVGCVVLSIATGYIVNRIGYKIDMINFIVIGFLCSIASELGDLTASYIKRQVGIKDYGNIIPGHGGILDRFDSILFTAPVVYYYFQFIQNVIK